MPDSSRSPRPVAEPPTTDLPSADPLDLLRRDVRSAHSPSSSVARQLLDVLLGDSMRPGDRLPSERRLTEAMGVGRSAIREAIAALEMLGVVETRAGSGTYLRSSTSELLPHALSWSLLMDRAAHQDLAIVRGALERAAAQEAARQPSEAAIARLGALIAAQEAAVGDPAAYIEADIGFHQQIAAMAQNSTLSTLLSTSRSLLRVWLDRAVEDPRDIEDATREHRAVFEAILARDVDGAATAMEAHMGTAARRILRAGKDS